MGLYRAHARANRASERTSIERMREGEREGKRERHTHSLSLIFISLRLISASHFRVVGRLSFLSNRVSCLVFHSNLIVSLVSSFISHLMVSSHVFFSLNSSCFVSSLDRVLPSIYSLTSRHSSLASPLDTHLSPHLSSYYYSKRILVCGDLGIADLAAAPASLRYMA